MVGSHLRYRGFTLTELLILIALTALLVSLLLPGLTMSRRQALSMQCLSNLREIGQLYGSTWGVDRWGSSPYDIDNGLNYDDTENSRDGDEPIKRPNRAESNGSGQVPDLGQRQYEFTERMEQQAVEQPRYWTLVCPVGYQAGMNSYGIFYTRRYVPFDRISSDEFVIGCSDYRVVDLSSNFAFRHNGACSLLFGDFHVESRRPKEFSDDVVPVHRFRRERPRPLSR